MKKKFNIRLSKILFLSLMINSQAQSQSNLNIDECVTLINEKRRASSLPVLQMHSKVYAAAQTHSEYQYSIRMMTIMGPDGKGIRQRLIDAGYQPIIIFSGNVAYNHSNCRELINDFWNSSSHRSNMLDYRMKYIGVGERGLFWTIYYTR